jgi:hypothetical protein
VSFYSFSLNEDISKISSRGENRALPEYSYTFLGILRFLGNDWVYSVSFKYKMMAKMDKLSPVRIIMNIFMMMAPLTFTP